jgi:hypothetical protein
MILNYLDNKLKKSNISPSGRKTLKVVYTIYGLLILYLCICQIAYGLGYLVAKLNLF